MTARALPYGAFNFLVDLGTASQPLGGFSDVSGLTTETRSPSIATATTSRTTSARSRACIPPAT